VVAARMSLSFPILFTTVPLYRHDYPLEHKRGDGVPCMQRMLFSDGGLSSNFPVHFFDSLLPRRPTFGISLEEFNENNPDRRVHLPMKAGSGIWLDRTTIQSVSNFLMSLVNAAKDWQDRLQSTLPGYRERIVNVYLKDTEGGLNLTMKKDTIELLGKFGDRAGNLMTGAPLCPEDNDVFDFEDHRWRRFLVAFARVEETLQRAAAVWSDKDAPTRQFIKDYMTNPASYHGSTPEWREDVFARFDVLMTHVGEWKTSLRDPPKDHRIPQQATDMRITPIP
jgi:hypothetical protein